MKTRKNVEIAVAKYYSRKFNGAVWCCYDAQKRAYCIRGESLPSNIYPNGWSLLDYIKPSVAQKLDGINQ